MLIAQEMPQSGISSYFPDQNFQYNNLQHLDLQTFKESYTKRKLSRAFSIDSLGQFLFLLYFLFALAEYDNRLI